MSCRGRVRILVAPTTVAYGRQRETTGATWALLALFIRELAAPYCVIAVILAFRRMEKLSVLT